MPKKYHPATTEMLERFQAAFDAHYSQLEDEQIRFDVQAVTCDGPHALSKGALALIKVVGPEERARRGPDVRILVDFRKYNDYPGISQEAMFAHELYHLIVVKDKNGRTKRDPYDRPVIRLKPDDWYITGFKEVADWYGSDSIEQITHTRMKRALYHQTLLQFYMGYDAPGEPALPLDRVDEDAENRHRKAKINGEIDVVRETFAALLSVGYTESQARKAIDSVLSGRGVLKTVSEMVDEIYRRKAEFNTELAKVDQVDSRPIKGEANAEILAGVREREAERSDASDDARRLTPITEIGLAERTLEALAEHDVTTVGELVSLRDSGALDGVLVGQIAMDVDDCLDQFYGSLPDSQTVDMATATTRPTRRKREKATA